MRGAWVWPSDPKEQANVMRRVRQEDELVTIIAALSKKPEGLSNAQLDKLVSNNSQWRTILHMRQLLALGFVQYTVQFFGNPGEYTLTDLGKSVAARLALR